MPINHQDLVNATTQTVAMTTPGTTAAQRNNWLNETELSARLKFVIEHNIIRSGYWKLEGSGRAGKYGHKADIVEASSTAPQTRIEVVFAWSKSASMPGMPPSTLSEDLVRLDTGLAEHVVAFIPACVAGYSVQNNAKPYGIGGNQISIPSNTFLLGNCIKLNSAPKLLQLSIQDIAQPIPKPIRGKGPRWSLSSPPQTSNVKLKFPNGQVERTVAGTPSSGLWAIVWSRS